MEITKKKFDELYISPKNVRNHPQKQIAEFQKSYQRYGQYRPLVVASDGEILIGNGLYEALKSLGTLETIDCVVLPADTPVTTKTKIMLSDNKIFQLGSDKTSMVDQIMKEIEDFDIPGYDESILKELYGAEEDIDSVVDPFVIDEAKIEAISNVAEQRAKDPSAGAVDVTKEVKSQYEPIQPQQTVNPAPAQSPIQNVGKYITCPHCGTKIYMS